jgi:KDO2-lipid IV(A) lauroyltransferase
MLPLCDGDERRASREARRAYRNIARYWVDVTSIPYRAMGHFERDHITLHHPEHLEPLSAPGPVILLSAHLGSIELPLQAISARGRAFAALVEDVKPPAFAEYLIELRSAAGGRFYPASFSGVRACYEALRRGGVVGLLADRDVTNTGMCVSLAGRCVRLPRGPLEMAQRTGATIIPVFATRTWRDRFTVVVEEPFSVDCSEAGSDPVTAAIQHWATLLERHLRAAPGQWTVLEDFWEVHACG